jgi:hypothetical protein
MHKPIASAVVLGMLTMTATAVAQYPPALPAPPAPAPVYGYPPPMPPRPRFGTAGQLAIANDANTDLIGQSFDNNGGSHWELTLRPAADYFVIQGLSVGGFFEYSHSSTSTPPGPLNMSTTVTNDTVGLGARVGYNIPFSDALSFWPKAGILFAHASNANANAAPTASGVTAPNAGNVLTLLLFAPFVYHPVSHFFLGLGPTLSTDVSSSPTNGVSGNSPKATTYGLAFTIGGWFLLG